MNAAEIIYSSSYAVGSTLRFPRVENVRSDKDFSSCTSIQEIETIKTKGSGKLFGNKRLAMDTDTNSAPSLKRQKQSRKKTFDLHPGLKSIDLSTERIETFHLKGKIVVVEPCFDIEIKRKLERLVVRHGGSVEQNTKAGRTHIFIQTAGTIKSKNVVHQGVIDVVKSDWLIECQHTFREYEPHDMVFATKETREKWTKDYDEFGDSWTKPATVQSIKSCLERSSVDRKVQQEGKDDLISELSGYRYFLQQH